MRFSFEEKRDLRGWRTPSGTGNLELSSRHAKDGTHSLKWSWSRRAPLICQEFRISVAEGSSAGMEGWIYCETPMPGSLRFCLGQRASDKRGNAPAYAFQVNLGFTGWRMFRIVFDSDARAKDQPPAGSVDRLEIWPPEETVSGCVYLDAIEIASAISSQRTDDFQIPEHGPGADPWHLFYARQKPCRPLPDTITEEDKQDFARIRERYFRWLLGPDLDRRKSLLRRAYDDREAYIHRGWAAFRRLGVRRLPDGSPSGPGLFGHASGKTSFYHVFYDALLPLAFDWALHKRQEAREAALLLFDYVHDQGWAEGSGLGSLWLNCLVFAPYCHAIALLRGELAATGRLDRAIRTAFWYQTFGKSFLRFDGDFVETNADALRSIVFTSLVMVLMLEDTPQKAQYMEGWRAWLHDALQISPRFAGVFKPDGLGFHHHGVYAGAYAPCAYEFCSLMAWLVHGTRFALSAEARGVLKQALLTQDVLTNAYDIPYAVMGRMPHPGLRLFSAYAFLALASDPPDPDLSGIFMRLWKPGEPRVRPLLRMTLDSRGGQFLCLHTPGRLQILQEFAERRLPAGPPPNGFWVKPWGALAVQRRKNWLAAVKGWSQYVWDFEMHPRSWAPKWEENVYGRYISYGTLQLLTSGKPVNPVDSGWNLERGWDWCRWPGATAPHLTLREIYDPRTSWATRFFSAAEFAGGVSSRGRQGVFALKIHEHFYDPTFLAFKTYFFFDDEIICLGSNIQSRDPHRFGTTLFQCWMRERRMPIYLNGRMISEFPFRWSGRKGHSALLMDPYGNGYWVPDAGRIHLMRGPQQSRDAWNRGPTSGPFSTCWWDHGCAPRDDGYGAERYHYVVLVQTKPSALERYAARPPYRVHLQNHQAHILEHFGRRTMAYAVFETDWEIPYGTLARTDTPVLVMIQEIGDVRIRLSLADPDLRLPKRRNMGYLNHEAVAVPSRPSMVRLKLLGQWRLVGSEDGVSVKTMPAEDRTLIETICRYGLTRELELERVCRPA